MSGDPGRLLLLEDDPDLRGALALVLRSRGWDVTALGSADEALEALGEETVEVAVVDLGLPDRSGPALVQAVRDALPGEARLVVFTGEEDAGVRRACREAGADDYVIKPVSGGELADRLEG